MFCSQKKTKRKKPTEEFSEAVQEYLAAQHEKYSNLCKNLDKNDHKRGCHYLGLFYERVRPTDQSLSIAGALYKNNCEKLDSGESCLKWGKYLKRGTGDVEKAARAFDKACKLGEGEGCYQEGMGLTGRDSLPTRWRIAEKKFVCGCALNHERSCEALSVIYRRGLVPGKKMIFMRNYTGFRDLMGVEKREREEGKGNLMLLYKDTGRLAQLCRNALGMELDKKGDETEFDLGQSEALTISLSSIPQISTADAMDISFGCLNGKIENTELCHRMSDWMTLRNMDVGSLMHDQNCKLGSGPSCLQLGKVFVHGLSVFSKDHERAASAFEKACDLGEGEACALAGGMRISDKYQCRKRVHLAERLFIAGCASNDENSCVQLSALYRRENKCEDYGCDSELFTTRDWRNCSLMNASLEQKTCKLGKFVDCAKLSEWCKQQMGRRGNSP